ncbi:phage holin family protein, partial [Rahnella sp. BCC 1045]|uniref:phage holin family protein n=1 Tax=Rahnella sp. BCC 1045 TaxID=2816251 RepID=UPI001C279209
SAWGGIVRYIMLRVTYRFFQDMINCLLQIVVSCFCGMMVSIILINRNISDTRILVLAGLGGVFSGPILNILGKKIAAWVDNIPPRPK